MSSFLPWVFLGNATHPRGQARRVALSKPLIAEVWLRLFLRYFLAGIAEKMQRTHYFDLSSALRMANKIPPKITGSKPPLRNSGLAAQREYYRGQRTVSRRWRRERLPKPVSFFQSTRPSPSNRTHNSCSHRSRLESRECFPSSAERVYW